MSFKKESTEHEEFRVALVLPWSQMVLAERHEEARRLPRIAVHKWERTAEQLTAALQLKWGMESILIDLLPGSSGLPACAVIEIRKLDSGFLSDGLVAVWVDDLDEWDLTQLERRTVCSIIAGDTQDRGPFSKVGWIEEAQAWIRDSVIDHRVEFSGIIQQYSAGSSSALVRFGTTSGKAYWLKAADATNAHEFATTQTISRRCPQYVPPFIAARADWNAWIMEEVGQPLYEINSLDAFVQAAHCLAELQITSIPYIEEFLASGCFEQRMRCLRAHVPALVQYLEDAMARQTSTKATPLNSKRLYELGCLIEEASAAMEILAIPDTLIHNDMNPGNILFDGVRAVFTDWSEACVGSPFLTFQHLLIQASEAEGSHLWVPRLKEIYKAHWRTILNETQIERAFALSPPLAIASYLCGRDSSFTSLSRCADSVQSYARSLTRHMDRFAQTPQFLEALCR